MIQPQQLGFGFDEMLEAERTAHIPSTMEEAVPFYRKLIERHHEAMMAGDKANIDAIRKEARDLAIKLNGGRPFGIAVRGEGAASLLADATAAPEGTMPLWGQTGNYIIDVDGMKVRIEQEGKSGLGCMSAFWPGFSAHAVDYDKPFMSNTGYRSFIGIFAPPEPDVTPEDFARGAIRGHLQRDHRGKPYGIDQSYADREMERRAERAIAAAAETISAHRQS
jgi:hypothetical protein